MEQKHFDAVLAKNEIAGALRQYMKATDKDKFLPIDSIIFSLKEIEAYIGVANQPCVEDIITANIY